MDRVMNDVDPYGTKPIHLSFDIDSLDPAVAPSTGTPVVRLHCLLHLWSPTLFLLSFSLSR